MGRKLYHTSATEDVLRGRGVAGSDGGDVLPIAVVALPVAVAPGDVWRQRAWRNVKFKLSVVYPDNAFMSSK